MVDGTVISSILDYGPAFLLLAVRAFAMIETAPLLSSESIPRVAKLALSGLVAFAVLPVASAPAAEPSVGGLHLITEMRYEPFSLAFVLLLAGEALIGIIMGFFLTVIFSAFATAGQFFSLQMGFAASETLDPLSQVENPVIGQFLYMISMLVFLVVGGFRDLFLGGFWRSVQSLNVLSIIEGRESVVAMIVGGLPKMFLDAIVISMPILGTLFLVSLTTGLISKAAPQINILSEGFPIAIMVGYIMMFASMPFMIDAFAGVVNTAFSGIQSLYTDIGQQIEDGGAL